jgi:hypothetical protein
MKAAQRCNDVEVLLVRMREKGLLTSIASACFKSADRIPSNAGDDRQAPLGPFMEPTPRFSHEVSPSLSCRRFSIYAPLAPVVRIATNAYLMHGHHVSKTLQPTQTIGHA